MVTAEHVDAWGGCACRPATYIVEIGGVRHYLYGCTCPPPEG